MVLHPLGASFHVSFWVISLQNFRLQLARHPLPGKKCCTHLYTADLSPLCCVLMLLSICSTRSRRQQLIPNISKCLVFFLPRIVSRRNRNCFPLCVPKLPEGHAPLVAPLSCGLLRYKRQGKWAISPGVFDLHKTLSGSRKRMKYYDIFDLHQEK